MQGQDDIHTAQQIRELGWEETKFIVISSHEKYLRKLYALDTTGFIDKPFSKELAYYTWDETLDNIAYLVFYTKQPESVA